MTVTNGNGSASHDGSRQWQNASPTFLVYGKTGWIGGLLGELLESTPGAKFEYGTARLEDRAAILADVERVRKMQSSMGCSFLPQVARSMLTRNSHAGQANARSKCCRHHRAAEC